VVIAGGNIAQATQRGAITPQSVSLNGYIPETHVAVSVSARLAPQKDEDRLSVIGEMSVAYGPYRVTIPDRILWRAVDPQLNRIEMFFCCWGVGPKVVGEEIRTVVVSGNLHSTIGVSVPYGIPYLEPGFENDYSGSELLPQFPYINILIHDGQVIGFEAWQFNGKDWVYDEYEWKNGRVILTDSFKGEE
jgi:hypothetical protein